MATEDQVQAFLNEFHQKINIYPEGVRFRDDRGKNFQALAELDISSNQRLEFIKLLTMSDYSEGPDEDALNSGPPLWVFGCTVKRRQVYIKLSIGAFNRPVVCISFHPSEYEMRFPLKKE